MTAPLFVAEKGDPLAGGARGWIMRATEERRKERSQPGEAVNDRQSPNTAGHVPVTSPGWR